MASEGAAARLAVAVRVAHDLGDPDTWHRACLERGAAAAVEVAAEALEATASLQASGRIVSRLSRFRDLAVAIRNAATADPLPTHVIELARECALPILLPAASRRRSTPLHPRGPLPSARVMAVGGAYTDAYSSGDDPSLYSHAIRQCLDELATEPTSVRTLLRLGDLQRLSGDISGAVDSYWRAGEIFEREGFDLRAVGVYSQVRSLLDESRADESDHRRAAVKEKLAALMKELGFPEEL